MTNLRPLTAVERTLLDALLDAGDFDGVDVLREQARDILASTGCSCGCGTIDLHPQGTPPRAHVASPLPAEGVVYDDSGEEVGGILVFLEDGLLRGLEVYGLGEEPLQLPPLQRVRLVH